MKKRPPQGRFFIIINVKLKLVITEKAFPDLGKAFFNFSIF